MNVLRQWDTVLVPYPRRRSATAEAIRARKSKGSAEEEVTWDGQFAPPRSPDHPMSL